MESPVHGRGGDVRDSAQFKQSVAVETTPLVSGGLDRRSHRIRMGEVSKRAPRQWGKHIPASVGSVVSCGDGTAAISPGWSSALVCPTRTIVVDRRSRAGSGCFIGAVERADSTGTPAHDGGSIFSHHSPWDPPLASCVAASELTPSTVA
jgi:hypothetical protein